MVDHKQGEQEDVGNWYKQNEAKMHSHLAGNNNCIWRLFLNEIFAGGMSRLSIYITGSYNTWHNGICSGEMEVDWCNGGWWWCLQYSYYVNEMLKKVHKDSWFDI